MTTTAVALDDHFATFVETEVAEGRYESTSAVIQAALRLLEERDAKLAALREALAEGEASGDAAPFDFDDFIARRRGDGHFSGS